MECLLETSSIAHILADTYLPNGGPCSLNFDTFRIRWLWGSFERLVSTKLHGVKRVNTLCVISGFLRHVN